jgi:hypothetical protein
VFVAARPLPAAEEEAEATCHRAIRLRREGVMAGSANGPRVRAEQRLIIAQRTIPQIQLGVREHELGDNKVAEWGRGKRSNWKSQRIDVCDDCVTRVVKCAAGLAALAV